MHRTINRLALGSLALGLLALGVLAFADQQTPPPTVASVDLNRYMGRWYEIARIPMFFQRKCTANTTAEYSMMPDGTVRVFNSCDTASGERISANGIAKVVDPATNAKLKVTFVNFLGKDWYLFGGDYWIVDLAPDYSWVIVGHPARKYGWILSRTPSLPADTLGQLNLKLRRLGYDNCQFFTTVQKGGIQSEQRLCKAM